MTKLEDTEFLPFFLTEPVYIVPEAELPAEPEVVVPEFLGENHREILILVYEEDTQFLSKSNQAFLEKVLQALDLSWSDVALVNWAHHADEDTYRMEGLSLIPFQRCVTFGLLPPDWETGHCFKQYDVTQDASGSKLLWADALTDIASDLEKKRRLWQGLKSMFE